MPEKKRRTKRARKHHATPSFWVRLKRRHLLTTRLSRRDKVFLFKRFLWLMLPLILLAFLAYLPAAGGDFFWLDETLKDRQALTATPVPWTLAMLLNELGLFNPPVMHLQTVMWHAVSAVLAWRIAIRLRIRGAWLGAALFAVHPALIPAVAWIAQTGMVMAVTCMLASLLCFLNYDTKRDTGYYVWALIFQAGALLMQPAVAASLPLIMLLVIWWKRGVQRRLKLSHVWRLSPFIMLVLGIAGSLAALNVLFEKYDPQMALEYWPQQAVAGTELIFRAMFSFFWPRPHLFLYPIPPMSSGDNLPMLLGPPIALIVLCLTLWWFRNHALVRPLAFAFGVLACAVLPVPLLPGTDYAQWRMLPVAWLYLPILSLNLLFAAGIARIAANLAEKHHLAAVLVVGIMLSGVCVWTAKSVYLCSDRTNLWEKTAAALPDSPVIQYELAKVYLQRDRKPEALAALDQALANDPQNNAARQLRDHIRGGR